MIRRAQDPFPTREPGTLPSDRARPVATPQDRAGPISESPLPESPVPARQASVGEGLDSAQPPAAAPSPRASERRSRSHLRRAILDPSERHALLQEFIHPHLVPVDVRDPRDRAIEDEGVPLDRLLRQWGGAPIPSWRRRCPGGIPMVLDSFLQIARLLGELKGAGWTVHRLHPSWFRLGVDGRVRLRAEDLLADGADLGRDDWAPYLAPELLLAMGETVPLGEEAGVYSLAAILHHCLAGAPPWSGRSETEVADRLLAEAPPTPIPTEKDLPRGVAPLLRDALALDPRQRPARFRGFAAALESAARGERPRSTPARSRAVPARSRIVGRVLLLMILVFFGVRTFRGGAFERERLDLLTRLESVLDVRPFPLHGEDSPAHPVAAQILRDAGEEAERWARDPEVLVALGWVELRSGKSRSAARSFLEARAWDTASAAPPISLGIARLEAGDRAGILDLEQGLSRSPRTARERLLHGIGLLYLHRFEPATAAFQTCLDEDGPSYSVWFHLALAAHYAGNPERAEVALARAVELKPHDVWGEWLAVERLALAGESEEALARIEARKSAWVESEPLLLRGAILHKRLGFDERALEWWERAHHDEEIPLTRETVRWTPRGLLIFPDRVLIDLSTSILDPAE